MQSWTRCGSLRDIDAHDRQRSRIGRHQAGDEPNERGLAGAVRPDKRRERTVTDRKRDVVERLDDFARPTAEFFAHVAAEHGCIALRARGHGRRSALRLGCCAVCWSSGK